MISYTVRTRTAELGIRMALGAQKPAILSMVIGEGAVLTLVGITAGIAGSLFLARFIASVAYEVSPTDPLVLGATAVILAAISVLACYAPARWASSVDPARSLRAQ